MQSSAMKLQLYIAISNSIQHTTMDRLEYKKLLDIEIVTVTHNLKIYSNFKNIFYTKSKQIVKLLIKTFMDQSYIKLQMHQCPYMSYVHISLTFSVFLHYMFIFAQFRNDLFSISMFIFICLIPLLIS